MMKNQTLHLCTLEIFRENNFQFDLLVKKWFSRTFCEFLAKIS